MEKGHSPCAQMLGAGEVKVSELQGPFVHPSENWTLSGVGWGGREIVGGVEEAGSRLAATLARPVVVVESGSEDA